jgi:hypothetical protein
MKAMFQQEEILIVECDVWTHCKPSIFFCYGLSGSTGQARCLAPALDANVIQFSAVFSLPHAWRHSATARKP